jgi:hypothetical protein
MKKTTVLLSSIFFLISGCNSGFSFENEIKSEAQKVMGQYVIKCGDFWFTRRDLDEGLYGRSSYEYYQFSKGPLSETIHQENSESDQLNGIEWKGTVKYFFNNGSYRDYEIFTDSKSSISHEGTHSGPWSEWKKVAYPDTFLNATAIKRKDSQLKITFQSHFVKMTCSDIPK